MEKATIRTDRGSVSLKGLKMPQSANTRTVPFSLLFNVFLERTAVWITSALPFSFPSAWSAKVRTLYFSFCQGSKCCCSTSRAFSASPSTNLPSPPPLICHATRFRTEREGFLQYAPSPSQWMSQPCQESNHAQQSFDTRSTNWTLHCLY